MRKKKRKYRFVLKPGSFLLLVPVIVLVIIIANMGSAHTSEPKENEVVEIKVEKTVAVTNSPKQLVVEVKPDPLPVERYANITMTENELKELAEIIYHEARGESLDGQQAVAEVVFNRIMADNFPDTVYEVIHQGEGKKTVQFSSVKLLGTADPMPEQYEAIEKAMFGINILPEDVVYFSRSGENNRVWGTIGNHVFCYQYIWE